MNNLNEINSKDINKNWANEFFKLDLNKIRIQLVKMGMKLIEKEQNKMLLKQLISLLPKEQDIIIFTESNKRVFLGNILGLLDMNNPMDNPLRKLNLNYTVKEIKTLKDHLNYLIITIELPLMKREIK